MEMLRIIPHNLAAAGFKRYEISNYTKHSYESVHNSAYWVGQDYLGIGAGAHSYVANYNGEQRVSADRWSTFALPAEYMKRVAAGSALSWRETLDSKALSFEFFYLGLRRSEGVSKLAFERYFGEPYAVRYGELIEQLQEGGFIQEEGMRSSSLRRESRSQILSLSALYRARNLIYRCLRSDYQAQ